MPLPALRKKAADAVGVDDPRNSDPTIPDLGEEAYAIAGQVMVEFEAAMASRTTAEWLEILDRPGVPAGPFHFTDQMLEHPQAVDNGYVTERQHSKVGPVKVVGPVLKMSATPTGATRAAPALGEHTDDVLASPGYAPDEVVGLRERGVVR